MRDASDRDGVARELAGAAATARSAHSAVATTITAITCLVRCFILVRVSLGQRVASPEFLKSSKIGQSIGLGPRTVKVPNQ